ncbi:MAG: hypothetical protein ACLPX5_06180 [Dissulfurispiraceae bacterium]
MKLMRCGARRFFEWKTIFNERVLGEPRLQWSEKEKSLLFTVTDVPDDSGSRYHYRCVFDVLDIKSIVNCLSEQAIGESQSTISKWFEEYGRSFHHSLTHSLLRLLLASSGMVPQISPLPEKRDDQDEEEVEDD